MRATQSRASNLVSSWNVHLVAQGELPRPAIVLDGMARDHLWLGDEVLRCAGLAAKHIIHQEGV
jgi:hypothetical protein